MADDPLGCALTDHLSSTRGEANADQSEAGQRRYLPFGGDRAVSGANDLGTDERYTGQKRIEAGASPDSNCELYYYGARWYLPGVAIFTQPDSTVPDARDPQALNRFSYAVNNPLRYTDPMGHYVDWGDDGGSGDDGSQPNYVGPGDWADDGSQAEGGDSTIAGISVDVGSVEFSESLVFAGTENPLSQAAGFGTVALDVADLTITGFFALATDASTLIGPEGPAAGELAYNAVSPALTLMDAVAVVLTGTADIASGRTGISVTPHSVSYRVGTDTIASVTSFMGGVFVRDVNWSAGIDAAQVVYDGARSTVLTRGMSIQTTARW